MRRLTMSVIVAVAAAFVGFFAGGPLGNAVFLVIPVIVVAGVAVLIGKTRERSFVIAAVLGFFVVLVPAVIIHALFDDHGASPSCDGFCLSRAGFWAVTLVVATFFGFLLSSAVLTLFLAESGRTIPPKTSP